MDLIEFKKHFSTHYPKLSYDDFQAVFLSSLQIQNLIAKTITNFTICLKELLMNTLDTYSSLFENILNHHHPISITLKQTPQWKELEKRSLEVKDLKFTLIGYELTTSPVPHATLNDTIQLMHTINTFIIQIHQLYLVQLQKEGNNIYKPQTNYA